MICPKCGCKNMTEELVSYQMECRNHLFCFEDLPAPKCPECGNIIITEDAAAVILAKVEQLSQKATISYHRCRWPRPQGDDEQQSASPAQVSPEEVESINHSVRK